MGPEPTEDRDVLQQSWRIFFSRVGEVGWMGEDEVLSLGYAKFEMVLDIQGEMLSK